CLKYVAEADLFVGIIARCYGWEPDGDKSITEMEYDAAKAAGKDCLMFVLDPEIPVNTEKDFDQGVDKWKKQEKLEVFKECFTKDQLPTCFNEKTLGSKVLHALNIWREARGQEQKVDPVADDVSGKGVYINLDTEIKSYGQKVDALYAHLPVAGFVTQLKVPIDIEEIYVPMRAILNLGGQDATYSDAEHAEMELREKDVGKEISLPAAFKEALNRKRKGIVILGDPGSGKTTHLKRILLGCIRKGPEALNLPTGMVPVFLPLRDLRDLDHGLDAFIEQQLDSPHLKTPEGFGKRLLDRGNLLFLLDGLDEVADLQRREEVARWILKAIPAHPTCRFVVTCRFTGYSPTVQMSEEFLEMHVRPFNGDEAEKFVRNWYRAVEQGLAKDTEQAGLIATDKSNSLLERLKE
ncbi:MAG: NACHT domain-containing protein, partial [Aestuariibacter sp.]|nr:NACHT domain-containing protein [Aestuariibacter sp.]